MTKLLAFALLCFALLVPSLTEARIGESLGHCERRYGKSQEDKLAKTFPVLKGAQHRIYKYEGWSIRVAFVKGVSVRQEYSKSGSPGGSKIQGHEAQAILEAERGRGAWEAKGREGLVSGISGIAKRAAMGFVWVRSDGALAMLRPGELILRVETASAAKLEAEHEAGEGRVPEF